MQDSINLQSELSREIAAPALGATGMFAARAAMAFVVIVFLTLTFTALEASLSGDESLSALEAAMTTQPN